MEQDKVESAAINDAVENNQEILPSHSTTESTPHTLVQSSSSEYILTEETERLKRAMNEPAGIEYIYQKISKSRLLEKVIKFQILAFLYAAKIDKKILDATKGATAVFFQEPLSRVDTTDLFQQLQKIDDDKLEQLVNSNIKSIIEDQGIYTILFFTELVKL